MIWTRRQVLRVGGTLAGALLGGRAALAAPAGSAVAASKRIALRNLHTGEALDVEFYRGGAYRPDALMAIQQLLRDFRNDQQHVIDPKLVDYLYDVAQRVGVEPVFSVLSGYRSSETNAQLRERSSGVASHSLHMEGRAIDVRLAGAECAKLAQRAIEMTRGGVGYYRQSDFVHLDTGRFRTWRG